MMFATFFFYAANFAWTGFSFLMWVTTLLYRSLGNRGREEEVQNRESTRLDIKDKCSFLSVLPCTSHGHGTPQSMVYSAEAQTCSSLSWSICLRSLFSNAARANNPRASVRVIHSGRALCWSRSITSNFAAGSGLHAPPCGVHTCCVILDKWCKPVVP